MKKNNSFFRTIINFFVLVLLFCAGGLCSSCLNGNFSDYFHISKVPNVLGFSDNENSAKYVVVNNTLFSY